MGAKRDVPGQPPAPSFKKVLRSQPPEAAERMCDRKITQKDLETQLKVALFIYFASTKNFSIGIKVVFREAEMVRS